MIYRKKIIAIATAWQLVTPIVAHADEAISAAQTVNMSCSGGVCSPTAADAVLNVGDLQNLLAAGSVKVTTTGSGVQANDIDVSAPLSWSNSSALTLDAFQSVSVAKAVKVDGAAGLTVTTNDAGSGGTFSFGRAGRVTFGNLASALVINGKSYKLIDSLPAAGWAPNRAVLFAMPTRQISATTIGTRRRAAPLMQPALTAISAR